METETKNILFTSFIGICLLIYSLYTSQFALIILTVEYIILSIIEYSFKELNYIILGDQLYFEWILSTVIFILVFVVFYNLIYEKPTENMALFALFYFNWFYITNLINGFLNTRVNNYVQYE